MNIEMNVVIGSWGSYNECNERALGSEWLDFTEFEDWSEIEEKLTEQGFVLDGIDEELFIQDIEGLPSGCTNWDFMSPKKLFETLKEAEVLDDSYKYDVMQAYIEVRSFSDFENLVVQRGADWNDDIYLYESYSWDDYGREVFENCCYQIDDSLLNYFDFEAFGESFRHDGVEEYSNGIIEIR